MVNTLSGSVCAYRKETVKPRFIRIDEVMALLDVTQDEAMDIALAAGARYQLAKIILVHKERLMKFMKHFARVPSSNKIVEKKFVRIGEASKTYSINDKLKEIIYQTQKSVDEDELTFKQSIAKSKECYVLLRVVRKIAKKKDKCEKQAIDNEFAIELDKDELKLFKGLFAEMFK